MGQNCCTGESKVKNTLIIDKHSVKKYFHSKIACHKEMQILSILAGNDLCPHIINKSENTIEMSFIHGITLAQAIEKNCDIKNILEKLVLWIIQFNKLTKDIVLDDINLKNFIWSADKGKIYGIDFERWHSGDNNINFAAVIAMFHTSRCEQKDMICSHLTEFILAHTGLDKTCLDSMLTDEIYKISQRRNAMALIRKSDCVIIAGGKSSRMGCPKGLLDYKGHSFTDHIIYNTSVFDRQYISANTDLYNGFGCEIIKDIFCNVGPMGAIHSCLGHCENEYVFFIPCDMPFITEESIFCLYNNLPCDFDAAVFVSQDRVFPTVGIYKKSVLNVVISLIESGNYKMMELLDNVKTAYITSHYPQQFFNINTPQDYKNI